MKDFSLKIKELLLLWFMRKNQTNGKEMKKAVLNFTAMGLMAFSSLYAQTAQKPVYCPVNRDYASKYTGFDLDVGVGYSGMKSDLSYTDVARGRSAWHRGVGDAGAALQARAGLTYGFFDSWIIGLDVYGQYNSAEHKFHFVELNHYREGKVALDVNIGFDARLGLVACPSNQFFITLGPDWARHTVSYQATHAGLGYSYHSSGFQSGVRVGAGAEQKLSKNWVMKEQFGYSWYETSTHLHTDGATTTVKPTLATMTFSAGYLF